MSRSMTARVWQEAQLQEPVLTRALTRFRPSMALGRPSPPSFKVAQSDETGYVQPTLAELLAVRGDNYTYHNTRSGPGASRLTAR